jgi:hypothetical protein
MGEKPTAAFVLSLIGAIFMLLGGLGILALASAVGALASMFDLGLGIGLTLLGAVGMVWGILALVGAILMNSSDAGRVRTGSILVLLASILSWFGTFGGFFIGFLLGLIGAILGLTWHPSKSERAPPPPP